MLRGESWSAQKLIPASHGISCQSSGNRNVKRGNIAGKGYNSQDWRAAQIHAAYLLAPGRTLHAASYPLSQPSGYVGK